MDARIELHFTYTNVPSEELGVGKGGLMTPGPRGHGPAHGDDGVDLDARLQPRAALQSAAQHLAGLAQGPGDTVVGIDRGRVPGGDPGLRSPRDIQLKNIHSADLPARSVLQVRRRTQGVRGRNARIHGALRAFGVPVWAACDPVKPVSCSAFRLAGPQLAAQAPRATACQRPGRVSRGRAACPARRRRASCLLRRSKCQGSPLISGPDCALLGACP